MRWVRFVAVQIVIVRRAARNRAARSTSRSSFACGATRSSCRSTRHIASRSPDRASSIRSSSTRRTRWGSAVRSRRADFADRLTHSHHRRQHDRVLEPGGRQDVDRRARAPAGGTRLPGVWVNNAGIDGQSTFGHLVLLRSVDHADAAHGGRVSARRQRRRARAVELVRRGDDSNRRAAPRGAERGDREVGGRQPRREFRAGGARPRARDSATARSICARRRTLRSTPTSSRQRSGGTPRFCPATPRG